MLPVARATLVSAAPEVTQRKRAALRGDPPDLRSQERELIRRALDRYRGNRF